MQIRKQELKYETLKFLSKYLICVLIKIILVSMFTLCGYTLMASLPVLLLEIDLFLVSK